MEVKNDTLFFMFGKDDFYFLEGAKYDEDKYDEGPPKKKRKTIA